MTAVGRPWGSAAEVRAMIEKQQAASLDRQVSRVRGALAACTAHGVPVEHVTVILRPDGMSIQPHPHVIEAVAVGILSQLADGPVERGDHDAPAFSVYAAGDVEVFAELHPAARPAGGA